MSVPTTWFELRGYRNVWSLFRNKHSQFETILFWNNLKDPSGRREIRNLEIPEFQPVFDNPFIEENDQVTPSLSAT